MRDGDTWRDKVTIIDQVCAVEERLGAAVWQVDRL